MKKINNWAVIEKQFTYKGHDCICTLNKFGFRCGYVSAPFNIDCDKIECHGGISFQRGTLPFDYGQTKDFYIGFDCGHLGDGTDIKALEQSGLGSAYAFHPCFDGIICTLPYVEKECKKIVDQIETDTPSD